MMGKIKNFAFENSTGETEEELSNREKFVRECAQLWLFGTTDESQLSVWKIRIVDTYCIFAMAVLSKHLAGERAETLTVDGACEVISKILGTSDWEMADHGHIHLFGQQKIVDITLSQAYDAILEALE